MRRAMQKCGQNSCGTVRHYRWNWKRVNLLDSTQSIRAAFTLVELLVVIGILGVLAALITPAIFQARVSARNAAIKAEIDMLHLAIMNYKNEYGSFPPAKAPATGSIDPAVANDAATRHLRRIRPRIASAAIAAVQVQCLPYLNSGAGTFTGASAITPDTAMVAWLWGFNTDPTSPVLPATNFTSDGGAPPTITVTGTPQGRKLLYDFDRSRITENYNYHPSGKPGSPFIYIDAANYGTTFGVYQSISGFNPDSFQILCAGLDEQWGTGDDLSNFWPGTRQDYEDSLE